MPHGNALRIGRGELGKRGGRGYSNVVTEREMVMTGRYSNKCNGK